MMKSSRDRIPPHNEDAERAVIGAMLIDESAVITAQQYISTSDFYSPRHRKIFDAIINLSHKSIRPDLLTLNDELEKTGKLDESGGIDYIASLTHAVPSSANLEFYSRIVQDCSIRRGLISISGEIGANAFDETKEPKLILEETQQQLFMMGDPHRIYKYRKMQDVIMPVVKKIHHLYETKPQCTGVTTGFPDLDRLTSGFQPSELIIIGARPGMGKTAIALSMAANISVKQKKPVAFFSMEMTYHTLMVRLLSSETGIDSNKIGKGFLTSSEFGTILSTGDNVYDAPLFIDDNPHMTILNIQAKARMLRIQEKVEIIFIDYIGLISEDNTQIPRWEMISRVSRSLKGIARELGIPVVALSQLRREAENQKPSLADIRESGSIEQDADMVMFINRDRELEKSQEIGQKVKLIIAKNRNGPVGTIDLIFLKHLTKFVPYAEEQC